MLDSSKLTDTSLPDTEVPDLEFAGLKAQYVALRSDIAERTGRVFAHGRFIMGPEVAELEDALAAFCGAPHAIAVSSGTDALLAPLMAAGIGPGDAVFVPAFTFPATAEVVALLGATPVFVDVDARTFNIDLADLAARLDALKQEGSLKPAAIMSVDLFGLPADYKALRAVADAEGMLLIADAAQSFGGQQGDDRVGALAPVTSTSFFPAKPLGCFGDGGAIFTDDDEMAARLKSIRVHGKGKSKYDIDRIGLNARLDTLQAAILLAKLPAFAAEIDARNQLADVYDSVLSKTVVTPARVADSRSAWAQYTIIVEDRDAVQKRLQEQGVPTAVYYPRPMHLQPAYAGYGDGEGSLPVSEKLAGKVMSLPMHGYMKEETALRIANAVRDAATG
jgi:UDP-2-acetamido-2-deoxy-ribo-hexuluronate aminotransferase